MVHHHIRGLWTTWGGPVHQGKADADHGRVVTDRPPMTMGRPWSEPLGINSVRDLGEVWSGLRFTTRISAGMYKSQCAHPTRNSPSQSKWLTLCGSPCDNLLIEPRRQSTYPLQAFEPRWEVPMLCAVEGCSVFDQHFFPGGDCKVFRIGNYQCFTFYPTVFHSLDDGIDFAQAFPNIGFTSIRQSPGHFPVRSDKMMPRAQIARQTFSHSICLWRKLVGGRGTLTASVHRRL